MAKLKVTPEKELLIGLIVDDIFAQQIIPILHINYLQASSSKTIAKWCIAYYEEYNTAPKMFIQDIYNQYKEKLPENDIPIIAKVLAHISAKYTDLSKYNTQYAINKARTYIRERKIDLLQEELERCKLHGEIDKAEAIIAGYTKIATHDREETNIWKDTQTITSIFERESFELFKFPGVLGEYIGAFRRGNLYGFGGVAKRGKSRWLAQTATIASMMRYNTVYISLEMDKEETTEMLMNTIVRKPITENKMLQGEPTTVRLPYFSEDNSILYEDLATHYATEKEFRKWQKKANIACSTLYRIIGQPGEMTIEDIENKLLSLELYEGFVPAVIFVDYANLIASKGKDNRDKVNIIWTGLKRLAKKFNCAVISATHMNGEALKKDAEIFNVGEDKRILHHVSGLYILNQTEDELEAGIMRVKATANRFTKSSGQVVVLYDFNTGRTIIDSRYLKDVPEYNEKL